MEGFNQDDPVVQLERFVSNKDAFWDFTHGLSSRRDDMMRFLKKLSDYNELVERLVIGGGKLNLVPNLVRAALFCGQLKELRLNYCKLNDGAAPALQQFFVDTPTCTTVGLDGNLFTVKGIGRLCLGLQKSFVLTFSFQRNGMGIKGAQEFAQLLARNRELEVIDLSYNSFKADAEVYFASGLEKNRSLRKLIYDHIPREKMNKQVLERLRRNQLNWKQKFIKDLSSEETGKWNRAKLMFIGQGRAGKTSTVNRLLSKGFDGKQDSTIGASVTQTQSSTTAEQRWKQVREDDPEYLGKGMNGNNAGRLVAAKKLVNRVDKSKQEKVAAMKKKAGIKDLAIIDDKRDRKGRYENIGANLPAPELTDAAKDLIKEEQKKDQEANDRLVAQQMQNDEDNEFFETEEEYRKRMELEERLRKQREADEDVARKYADAVFQAAREGRDSITFSLWDYGGQSVFYALHHLFLTKYGVYVLCVDVTEILKAPDVAKEYLLFWLNSTKLHAPGAPVMIVGTHIDSLEKPMEEQQAVDDFIKAHFMDRRKYRVESMHPRYSYYPVDNKNNKGVAELRFDIERISRAEQFVTADVSVKWMFCLDRIMIKNDVGGKSRAWMKLKEVAAYAKDVGITNFKEVDNMLNMFHELGVLVRLTATQELRNLITLDPQWLLDGLCKVIRDERLHQYDVKEVAKVGLTKEMNILYKQGLASMDVMKFLWSEDKFRHHFNYLLDLMKHMVLISDWDFRDEKMFIIPSLLIARPEDEDLFDTEKEKEEAEKKEKEAEELNKLKKMGRKERKKEKERLKKEQEKQKKEREQKKLEREKAEKEEIEERVKEGTTDYVIFDFSHLFLPMGVFQRLVCMCVAYATSIGEQGKKEKVKEPQLFSKWAKIWMGKGTVLYLDQRDNEIWLSVEDPKTAPTCFKAVRSMIEKLNNDLMNQGLQWELKFVKEKKKVVQKRGEKPKITIIRELEYDESEGKEKQVEPWYEKEEAKEEKIQELVDLEDFVDLF